MAIITISRQVAALGDEIASALATHLGYTFVQRKQMEERIVALGFPKEKLLRYDEKKPGFFASLVKDRDEYLNYLQYAVLEAASEGNCILIGRGAFKILEDCKHLVSLRFVSPDDIRLERLKAEKSWTDKQARTRIEESDSNRRGFHKSFFNLENEDASHFLLTLNTGILSETEAVKIIETVIKQYITAQKEEEGKQTVLRLLKGQRLINQLLYDYKLNISFLHAVVEDSAITLQGVADSQSIVERAVQTAANLLPSLEIRSAIQVVQNYKTFQQ